VQTRTAHFNVLNDMKASVLQKETWISIIIKFRFKKWKDGTSRLFCLLPFCHLVTWLVNIKYALKLYMVV